MPGSVPRAAISAALIVSVLAAADATAGAEPAGAGEASAAGAASPSVPTSTPTSATTARGAATDDAVTGARLAVAIAGSAFEYRDFRKVIDVLSPWVHPPRIAEPDLMKEARRLLGISLHIEGNADAAKEEFAQVLLADPTLKLDPFMVPPAVVESFEQVRVRMRPVLDRIIGERRGPQGPPIAVPHAPPNRLAAYLPLGLGHLLVLDQPGWGALWLGLEVAGIASNVIGYFAARSLTNPDDCLPGLSSQPNACGFMPDGDRARYDMFVGAQYAGLALFFSAWAFSGIQGHLLSSPETTGPGPRPAPGPSLSIGAGSLELSVPF